VHRSQPSLGSASGGLGVQQCWYVPALDVHIAQYSNVLHCTVLHCDVQYCTVLCCSVLLRSMGLESATHCVVFCTTPAVLQGLDCAEGPAAGSLLNVTASSSTSARRDTL